MNQSSEKQLMKKISTTGTVYSVDLPKGIRIIDVGFGNSYCVMIAQDGSVYEFNSQIKGMKKINIKNGMKAVVGHVHYLVLTRDGMVYSKGDGLCLGLGETSTATTPTMIPYFQENNVKIVDIKAGVSHSYFLTEDGDYYACGQIFSKSYSYGIFFKGEKDQVWGHGEQVVNRKKNYSTLEIFKDKKIVKVAPGYQKLLLLVKGKDAKDNKEKNFVYFETRNGEPTLWPQLTKENVIDVDFGCHQCLMLTKDGRVLASGSAPKNYKTVRLPTIPKYLTWKIVCGSWDSVVFPIADTNTLILDMKEFQDSGLFADLEILDQKVHSSILKWRTGKEGTDATEILKTFSEKHINQFLDWCYLCDATNIKLLQEVAKAFDFDEDSKDFEILVKDDDEINEELIAIPVHKWVIQARSGLFREMFQNINEEKNQVKDFSELGPDSMEIFIKFLYTNTVELTADHVPEFVLQDLEIVPEYYKLNEKEIFSEQIH
ncbi:btk-binding protein-related [Anaeramoeba flamelloides]|uniref:Btk-binding protein-related n=1 Tax=Anaeramoeba flamelloides TaxID=1746091 RepID=A0AAV7YFA5_9EUKA|nr:btk-binding protein-related [Anaeramoeba flamelloides]